MSGPFNSLRMKRKHLSHDDFSFSSPSPKTRRLDASVLEEDETLSPSCVNDERAIVLFKPMNSYLLNSSPNFSVSVDSDIISGFTKQFPWTNQSDRIKLLEEEEESDDETKECRAVVPWVPSQFPTTLGSDISPSNPPEQMEAEEMGEAAMDVEEDNNIVPEQGNAFQIGGIGERDGLPQWQQQHCMIPQLPQNNSTPIAWFR